MSASANGQRAAKLGGNRPSNTLGASKSPESEITRINSGAGVSCADLPYVTVDRQ